MPKIIEKPNYVPAVDFLDQAAKQLLDQINSNKIGITQLQEQINNAEQVLVSITTAAEALRPAPTGTVVN